MFQMSRKAEYVLREFSLPVGVLTKLIRFLFAAPTGVDDSVHH